jgi:hypothetical protein
LQHCEVVVEALRQGKNYWRLKLELPKLKSKYYVHSDKQRLFKIEIC